MQQITTREELIQLGSAYTIIGAGGELSAWTEALKKLLLENQILNPDTEMQWATWTGAVMNEALGLTGDNAYPDDLTFLAFKVDGLDVGKLAMFKLQAGDRWLDDVINNDIRRQQEGN